MRKSLSIVLALCLAEPALADWTQVAEGMNVFQVKAVTDARADGASDLTLVEEGRFAGRPAHVEYQFAVQGKAAGPIAFLRIEVDHSLSCETIAQELTDRFGDRVHPREVTSLTVDRDGADEPVETRSWLSTRTNMLIEQAVYPDGRCWEINGQINHFRLG